jgi:uncharacterized protein YjiS (DUF1127 family)
MSNLQSFKKILISWRQARQQRKALLDILSKPSDHLLRDAGLTRREAQSLLASGKLQQGNQAEADCNERGKRQNGDRHDASPGMGDRAYIHR